MIERLTRKIRRRIMDWRIGYKPYKYAQLGYLQELSRRQECLNRYYDKKRKGRVSQ